MTPRTFLTNGRDPEYGSIPWDEMEPGQTITVHSKHPHSIASYANARYPDRHYTGRKSGELSTVTRVR